MTQWATFVGLSLVVLILLLVLSHLSRQVLLGEDRTLADFSEHGRDGSQQTVTVDAADRADRQSDVTDIDVGERSDRQAGSTQTDTSDRTDRFHDDADLVDRSDRPADGTDPSARQEPLDSPVKPTSDEAGSVAESDDTSTNSTDDTSTNSTDDVSTTSTDDVSITSTDDVSTTTAIDGEQLSPGVLLANVALSQGLFAGVLVAAAWYTQIPLDALGIRDGLDVQLAIAAGLGLGLALYAANEVGAAVAGRAGFDHSEELRRLLAPETTRGWVILLVGVLPIIAVFEELLFRAALIGVVAAGYGISPWLLAVGSSVLFALGHGIQGPAGILVTGLLGFVLAAAFVVTNSLLLVVVAHYVVNALEFVVHEGLEIEWADAIVG